MHYLIYISTAVKLMGEEELTAILVKSRHNNTANGLTGVLLYSEGTFIQALEGEEEEVNKTYDKIGLDKRHKNIINLISGPLETRIFPDWSMGFTAMSSSKLNEVKGFIDPAGGLRVTAAAHPAITVLKTFIENNGLSGKGRY